MEFRIVPLILVTFNICFLAYINPDINNSIDLHKVANVYKMLAIACIILAMSIGSFVRHYYYSKTFKIAYFICQFLSLGLAIAYFISIKQQHLG
jgi:ABC-type uncharacterized transport system fused permease/ATPase subunit